MITNIRQYYYPEVQSYCQSNKIMQLHSLPQVNKVTEQEIFYPITHF